MRQGPARSLGCVVLLAILAAWPTLARADGATTEYADPQYRFTFRFPADWQRQEVPTPGGGGEVRLAAKSAARPIFVLAIVSPIATAITRDDDLEKRLAESPVITVPTITLEGDANGAPHPDPSSYARKFSGKYLHRTIRGGIGHNLPQEAPQAFAQAVVDAARS